MLVVFSHFKLHNTICLTSLIKYLFELTFQILFMNDRRCLQCYEQLTGRADQKFCTDQCRSTYNNQHYFETNTVIRSVNRILKKNYSILSMLRAKGIITINKSELQKKGYRFEFFTFTSSNRNCQINYFCYDQGYREQEYNKLILVQRDLNID
jgi:hypothetical protein